MNTVAHTAPLSSGHATTALENDFPIVEISQIAEQESWRKEINRPIYHIHKWWATRLGSVFRGITLAALSEPGTDVWQQFYKHHQLSDKVVLDPFMGSGTTLGETVKLGAKAIGCDINPVSTFQVRQAFTRVAEVDLRAAFAQLEQQVAPEIRRYYQTRDPATGEWIPVLYYFWVKTVTTPDNETIPLFSRYVFSQDAYPKKKPQARMVCPSCLEILEGRYDAADMTCPHCAHRFNPQQGPASGQYVTGADGKRHRIKDLLPPDQPPAQRMYAMMALRANGEKIYLPVRKADKALYAEAEARLQQENLPLPTLAVRPGHNTNQALGYNYRHWRDFFNARQLLCLGLLLRGILELEDVAVREQMLCLFSGTLEFNNLFCSFKGEGTGAVRHMFSHHILKPERAPLESSVWGTDKSSGTFSTLFESRLLRAKRYLDEPFEVDFQRSLFGERLNAIKTVASSPIDAQVTDAWPAFKTMPNAMMVLNGNSADLPLPDKSVDSVVTDPPYFDFVHYSELSDFFFAWLSPVLKGRYAGFDHADSSSSSEVQHKDSLVFARQLSAVFSECHRVLKDDGVLAFSFHHSRAEGWAAIHDAITSAGFAVVAAHPVHAELRAASPKTAAKEPISLDAILVCKKQSEADVYLDEKSAIASTKVLAKRLEKAGMSISASDRFVILAAQMLIVLGRQQKNFAEASTAIQRALQNMVEPVVLNAVTAS